MDINKENTKYLASLLSNCGATQDEINDLSFDDEVGFFESNRLADWFVSQINFGWRVWQAAKAHEAEKLKGCVLVPVQCPDPDFADSLFDELSKKAIGEFGDDLLIHFSDIDEEKIWALMVEAAKAQAVPEGFVLVPVKEITEWYLDESENIYREDPDWLCDISIGDVVEVEHRVSYELDQDPVFAAIQWDDKNGDVGYYEIFKSKAEAEKVAAHCKAMIEAQEQAND